VIDPLFGFDSAFLEQLDRLSLLTRQRLPGPAAGARRSPRHGSSVEFADFRDYSAGDDFRRIDWNAYARLDRLFLRLYSAEDRSTLAIFLDHSASMSFGRPSKALTAARLAAIVSYVALRNDDHVTVTAWSEALDRHLPSQSGRAFIPRVWKHIAETMESAAGETNIAALQEYGRLRHDPGPAIVISDFFSDSWDTGLRGLLAAGQDVSLVQVLAPEEIDPELRGDWELRDSENGAGVEVTISPRLLRRYRAAFDTHTDALRQFCARHGCAFLQLPSDIPLSQVTLSALQTARILR